MKWGEIAVIVDAAVGAIGLCLMLAAFVLVARRGGWKKAISEPANERRWPAQRVLMLAGAVLGVLFSAMLVILWLVPGGIPWK